MQDGTNPIEAKKIHNSNLISKDKRINKESSFKSNIKSASNIQNAKYQNSKKMMKYWIRMERKYFLIILSKDDIEDGMTRRLYSLKMPEPSLRVLS